LLTPPSGLNAYVVKGAAGDAISLATIFRGLTWFIAREAVIMDRVPRALDLAALADGAMTPTPGRPARAPR
jgi:hypothetical protein